MDPTQPNTPPDWYLPFGPDEIDMIQWIPEPGLEADGTPSTSGEANHDSSGSAPLHDGQNVGSFGSYGNYYSPASHNSLPVLEAQYSGGQVQPGSGFSGDNAWQSSMRVPQENHNPGYLYNQHSSAWQSFGSPALPVQMGNQPMSQHTAMHPPPNGTLSPFHVTPDHATHASLFPPLPDTHAFPFTGQGQETMYYGQQHLEIVPQTTYEPEASNDRRRYINEINLDPPIQFYTCGQDGVVIEGFRVSEALKGHMSDLIGREDETPFQNSGSSISIRINWPGYRPFTQQINVQNWRNPRGPIALYKLAKGIAKCVEAFMKDAPRLQREGGTGPGVWRVGQGGIDISGLTIGRLYHVSKGSWQPEIRVSRQHASTSHLEHV